MSKRHSMENLELVKLTPDKVNVRTAPLYCSAHTSSTRRASCYITLCYWTCDDCDPFLCWRVKSGTATSWPNSPNPRWLRAPPSSSLLVVCEGRSTSLVAPVRSSRTPAIPWIPVSHLHRDHKKYADLGHSFEDHSESTHVFKIKQLLLFYFFQVVCFCFPATQPRHARRRRFLWPAEPIPEQPHGWPAMFDTGPRQQVIAKQRPRVASQDHQEM